MADPVRSTGKSLVPKPNSGEKPKAEASTPIEVDSPPSKERLPGPDNLPAQPHQSTPPALRDYASSAPAPKTNAYSDPQQQLPPAMVQPPQVQGQLVATARPKHITSLIKQIVDSPFQQVALKITQNVSQSILTSLDEALARAQKPMDLFLGINTETDGAFPHFPQWKALRLCGLHFSSFANWNEVSTLLKGKNPHLTHLSWCSPDQVEEQVNALRGGSHQLRELEFSELPGNGPEFLDMLRHKPQLQALTLGEGKFVAGGLLPAQILASAPQLSCLTLEDSKFSSNSFIGCGKAFAQSSLTELNFHRTRFKGDLSPDLELLSGLKNAPMLVTLGFKEYGESSLDKAMVQAFAENPHARTIKVSGKGYESSLNDLLGQINTKRVKKGWEVLKLIVANDTRAKGAGVNN